MLGAFPPDSTERPMVDDGYMTAQVRPFPAVSYPSRTLIIARHGFRLRGESTNVRCLSSFPSLFPSLLRAPSSLVHSLHDARYGGVWSPSTSLLDWQQHNEPPLLPLRSQDGPRRGTPALRHLHQQPLELVRQRCNSLRIARYPSLPPLERQGSTPIDQLVRLHTRRGRGAGAAPAQIRLPPMRSPSREVSDMSHHRLTSRSTPAEPAGLWLSRSGWGAPR